MIGDVRLSRAVAHALRHAPWLYELELDPDGWAPVDQLLEALRSKGGDWRGVDQRALERMMATATKRRYEIDDGQVRALYGHSLPDRLRRSAAEPPELLFHGTSPQSWPKIEVAGLRPMRRQYVHLSSDVGTANEVGRRKSRCPLVLTVRAGEAVRCGVAFYEGNEQVWLADRVPSQFVEVEVPAS